MTRAAAVLLLLALAACGGSGVSGPYTSGGFGANVREDTRTR